MPGRFLLDTNIVIALFRPETAVEDRLKQATEVYLPAIVLGELYFGARNSRHIRQNITRIEQFATHNEVIVCDTDVAREYGAIRKELQDKGRPIPDNDIWIAAVARLHRLVLVSRDGHFQEVANLLLEVW